MSDLFNYFIKAASAPKPDAAMRRGSYAQASASGQYRSSTIGHQGLSKRTAAQLRQTHNLPKPGQQPTGSDGGVRRGIAAKGATSHAVPVNPSPAPRPAAKPAQPATVSGAPTAKPGDSLAKTFAPYIPEVANLSDASIRSAYTNGAYRDSHRGLGTDIDKSIQADFDWQLYNRLSQLGLNMYGDNSSQATAINTALQHLDALRYSDDAAGDDPSGQWLASTQAVSPNPQSDERALAARSYSYADARRQARPVRPR